MTALGTFASNPIDYSQRIFYKVTTPPKTSTAPVVTNRPSLPAPISTGGITSGPPTPTPIKTFTPPAILAPPITVSDPPTIISDPKISGLTVAAPTGATTGTQTGSTGTSDVSRLFDMIAAGLAPQSITPGLSPTSVVDTSTVQPTSGGTSPLALLIVGIAIAGGIFWYMKRKKTRAAA